MGVIFPFTSTPELARRAVEACKYPGPRANVVSAPGWRDCAGPCQALTADFADRNAMVVVIIEQKEAVERIEEIAAVPGMDVIFIGTSDLSFSPRPPRPPGTIRRTGKRWRAWPPPQASTRFRWGVRRETLPRSRSSSEAGIPVLPGAFRSSRSWLPGRGRCWRLSGKTPARRHGHGRSTEPSFDHPGAGRPPRLRLSLKRIPGPAKPNSRAPMN